MTMISPHLMPTMWGGQGGGGARENRRQEGYGRRGRKGREAGEECKTLTFSIY